MAGLGASVLVAGFDPLTRRWLASAEAAGCPSFAGLPPLDGVVAFDPASLEAAGRDQGNIVLGRPCAVLRAGSVDDVVKMVQYCRRHGIAVAGRGEGHTSYGQSLAAGGLVIENRAMRTIHSIAAGVADVDAGVLWRELLEAAYPIGWAVPALTGYTKLSIGGTLSVGGVGALNTNRAGLQVDNVLELEVVTGAGERVVCSATRDADLFESVLAGLGQFAVIVRAKLRLVQAPRRARTYSLNYADTASFFRDFRTLLHRGELDAVYNVWFPFGTNLAYQMQAVAFYDSPLAPPDDLRLLRDLSIPAPLAMVGFRDQSYLDAMTTIDTVYDAYIAAAGFDRLVKPWFDMWLPESAVEAIVGDVVPSLRLRDVGPTGFVLILPQLRGSMRRPLFRLPDVPATEMVYLFDILTSAIAPGDDPAFATEMLARNRRIYDRGLTAGGTRYPIGALEFTRQDWKRHYGELWPDVVRRKRRYDPAAILGPGLGIFG